MALEFYSSIDLNKNELQNAVIQNSGTQPGSAVEGQIYFDSTSGDKALHYYNGSAWIRVAGATAHVATDTIASGDFVAFSDQSEDPSGSVGNFENKLTVDNLITTSPKLLTEAAIAAADYVVFLDGGATGDAKKESLADFVTFIAGSGLSMSSSKLVVGTLNQNTTGSAATLTNARQINGVAFDGSASITVTAAAGTLSGNTLKSTVVTSSLTSVGALNSGSITSDFGAINNGASAITTTGLISGGSLDIDDVVINGSNIGHTNDTDLIALANGAVTVNGSLTVTGTTTTNNVETVSTSSGVIFEGTAADGHDATLKSVVASSDKTYTLPNVTGHVALFAADPSTTTITSTPAELNKLDGATVTTAEINLIDGGTSRTTNAPVDGDGILHNNGGTMEMTKVETFATYFASEISSQRMVVATIDHDNSTFLAGDMRVTITHNLGTADVMVQLYDMTTEANVYADIARTTDDMSTASTSVISIDFGTPPPNDIRCVITSLKNATAAGTIAYT